MSFQELKTNSFCVGQKHYSGFKDVVGGITFNKKNGQETKLIIGKCVICDRKKTLFLSENTIQAERLGNFF